MDVVSELNPLAGQRHERSAWNALTASCTYRRLQAVDQEAALAKIRLAATTLTCYTLAEVLEQSRHRGVPQFHGDQTGEEHHWPALDSEYWYPISNPFVECFGADPAVPEIRNHLQERHGVGPDMTSMNLPASYACCIGSSGWQGSRP